MDYGDTNVQEIYRRSWRSGLVEPIGNPVPLSHFLEVVRETDTTLHSEPFGKVEGGEWDGGVVIRVETKDMPLFFVIPPDALGEIREYLSQDDYTKLLSQSNT